MRSIRPPTLAALAILVAAGAIIAVLTLDTPSEASPDAAADDVAAAGDADGPQPVAVSATANAYDRPARSAEVVLVVPAGQRVGVHGRTDDGAWVLVSSPAGGAARGWLRATAFDLDAAALAALLDHLSPVPLAEQQTTAEDADAGLPDLAIADAFLLQSGELAVSLRNAGRAALPETVISLHVARAEGEIIGVLRIGPTALAAGASATVVSPVRITEPGTYRLEIDPTDEVLEESETNNTRSALLIPLRPPAADDDAGGDDADGADDAGDADGANDDASGGGAA